MSRWIAVFAGSLVLVPSGVARQIKVVCGSGPEQRKEEAHLHRQAELARRASRRQSPGARAESSVPLSVDIGNVAILEDADGVVARRNLFNLDQQTLTFRPAAPGATAYAFQMGAGSYDAAAAASGTLTPLADDDFHEVPIGFPFPFFGQTYRNVFVNSDGNLTFVQGDNSSTDRSLGSMVAGPPRISPLFEDLDPSQSPVGVMVTSDATRLVVSWVQVPEFSSFGVGLFQTFQVRLYPDGHIQFAYNGIDTSGAVVGIGPGNLQGSSSVVSFLAGSTAVYSSTVAERFGGADEVDIETAAQKFFETHDDSYDYVAFINDEGIAAGYGAVAWEETVRNNRSGYGNVPVDDGAEYGSASRLQAVLNLGPLNQYPASPTDLIPLRASSGYDMLKLLGHEVGHLFLAYATVPDPNNPAAEPMLGIQLVHWAFNFNADASFMEGNRIQDNGPNAGPRFITTATVDQYSALDQYLMGFRAPSEVPPMFLVTGNPPGFSTMFPQVGIMFDGGRQDIQIGDIIQAEGRRTPDSTVAQRHFRMAFVLIVKQGSTPSAAEVAQVEGYRSQFEAFYGQAAGGRAYMDAGLLHALELSVAPASGVQAGGSMIASVSIQQPAAAPLTVILRNGTGSIGVPPSVVIPAGAASASFTIDGMLAGVDDLTATPSDDSFETAYARIQVLPASALLLSATSGNWQVMSAAGTLAEPVIVRVTDQNNLSYPGVQVQAVAAGGGAVTPQSVVTDASGQATFQWTPGQVGARLQVFLSGDAPASGVTFSALPPASINLAGVVNSASSVTGISPGGLVTIYGTTLSGGVISQAGLPWPTELGNVTVEVNNELARLLYVSDAQINFMAPFDLKPGTASLTVLNGPVTAASLQVTVMPFAPGIFADASTNFGDILNANTTLTTQQQPAARGGAIEIFCTGLGAVQDVGAGLMETVAQPRVTIGNVPAPVLFSGLAPVYNGGLYQVNVQIPQNAPQGTEPLVLTIGGVSSNTVKVAIK